jgi:hypothetical protein
VDDTKHDFEDRYLPTCSQKCHDSLLLRISNARQAGDTAKFEGPGPAPAPTPDAVDPAYEAYSKGWEQGQDDARR